MTELIAAAAAALAVAFYYERQRTDALTGGHAQLQQAVQSMAQGSAQMAKQVGQMEAELKGKVDRNA